MFPLFNKNCDLVAWVEPDEHIFDTDMNWVAYISNEHAWSVQTGNWLGPVIGLTFLDQNGKPVAWNPEQSIETTLRPIRPVRAIRAIRPIRPIRPVRPIRPIRPVTPVGGWSALTWQQWLSE